MNDWRDDPLTVAVARLIAILIIGLRLKRIVRWLAKKTAPLSTERTDQ